MPLRPLALSLVLITLAGCDTGTDKDGVPQVDIHGTIVASTDPKALAFAQQTRMPVPSTRMIAVQGKQMPLQEFMLTYCQGKYTNDTCLRGMKIARIDSSSGPRAELPAGL